MANQTAIPDGYLLVECEAGKPDHFPIFVSEDQHDDHLYLCCPWCILSFQSEQLNELHAREGRRRHRRHAWRAWTAVRKAASWAYALGVIAGYGTSFGGGCRGCVGGVRVRGRRVYVLGWERWKWSCVLQRRHWPGEPIEFGLCGKCLPWSCCGSTTAGHADDCFDEPGWSG